MKKAEAEILNAIPIGVDLETYFNSLNIFEKRELITELEVCKSSYLCSFLCYFGIKEAWFIYYLIGINLPLSIFLLLDVKDKSYYGKVIKKLERRLSQ